MLDRRLVGEARRHRGRLLSLLVTGVVHAGLIVGGAWLLSHVIGGAFLDRVPAGRSWRLLGLFALVSLARVLVQWGRTAVASGLARGVKVDVRARLLRHLHTLGPLRQQQMSAGETTWLATEGVGRLEAWFGEYLPQLISAAFIPVTILAFVLPTEWLTGLVLLLTAPLIPMFMVLIGDVARTRTREQWLVLSRLSGHFLDALQGLTTLKMLGRAREETRHIARASDLFRRRTMGVLRVAFLSALTLELVATISTAVVAVEVGLRLLHGRMTFEPALFVLILAPEFYLPLRLLGVRFHAGMHGVEAAARIFAILELEPPPVAVRGRPLPPGPPHVVFRGVTAGYADRDGHAVRGIDLAITPGETVVLAGPSGAGKSTVARLLLRELEPVEGEILAGGVPIAEIPVEHWLERIGWVPQRPHLFDGTLAENLRLARPDATEGQMERALRAARLDSWYRGLRDGLHARLGEEAHRLSDGERQRLALARAFLKDAPLLILDEHVSNLDPENDRRLQEVLREMAPERSVLIIAHRLSTIMAADRLVVLEEGAVAAAGRPADLRTRSAVLSRWLRLAEESP